MLTVYLGLYSDSVRSLSHSQFMRFAVYVGIVRATLGVKDHCVCHVSKI